MMKTIISSIKSTVESKTPFTNRIFLNILLCFLFFLITPFDAIAAFRFVSWGDGQNESARVSQTSNLASPLNLAFTIFNGDLENDGSTLGGLTTMTNAMGSLFTKTFLVRGNHDTHISGSTSVWTGFFNFSGTSSSIGATNYTELNSDLTYSFDYDNSRFIAVDVPGDVGMLSSAQISFINSRLTDAETLHPEIVHAFIYFHGPIYCVESTHCSCSSATANCTPSSIVSIINNHPVVSAFFHGHEHILGWTHISSSRVSGITHEVEQFITSPAGGWTYNSYIYPNRVDYYNTGSTQGFASIDVNGNSFTVNFYRVGNTSPVWTRTFTKSGGTTIFPSLTPGGPTPTTYVPPNPTPSQTNALLVNTINTNLLNPAMPDPAGITYLPNSGRLLVSDSEVDEMPIYANKNLFELSLTGVMAGTGSTNTLAYSHEPTGVSYNSDDNILYVSDDDQQRVFTVRPGSDGVFGSGDDTSSYFSTSAFGATDPESVAYANISGTKYLFIADGANHYVYQTTLAGGMVNRFDVSSMGLSDIEGVTYYKNTGTLFILEGTGSRKIIVETTISGSLLRTINMVSSINPGFSPILPSDLVFAPSSSTSDSPSVYNLYITDRGVDNDTDPNENDGKIYEMSLSGITAPTPTYSPPPPTSSYPKPTPPGECFISVPVYGQSPSGTLAACTNSLTFSWTDNPVVDHYALRIDQDPISCGVSCSSINPGDTCIDTLFGNSYTRAVTPGKTYAWWVEAYAPCGTTIPTPFPTSVPTSAPYPTAYPTSPPISPPVGGRVLKYYGVDRGNPVTSANYTLLSQHAVKTIVVDTDVHGSVSSWQNIVNLANTYNFNVVIWPSDWTDPVPNCGWESPYAPVNGDFITRVKPLLDAIGGSPRIIGIVNAHEPMWSCITTVADMETIKNQLKDYVLSKFGRTDFKVWNYIDNVTDMRYLSDYTGPSDIARVMDVAVTWQHCFGGAEGTCPQAQQKIVNDRAAITNAGLEGRVELLYLFQTFAMGTGYRMPTETEMHDWSCSFLNTGALDGFLYYTWGACWYDSDLYCPAATHPYQNLWPIMNNVYNECVNK